MLLPISKSKARIQKSTRTKCIFFRNGMTPLRIHIIDKYGFFLIKNLPGPGSSGTLIQSSSEHCYHTLALKHSMSQRDVSHITLQQPTTLHHSPSQCTVFNHNHHRSGSYFMHSRMSADPPYRTKNYLNLSSHLSYPSPPRVTLPFPPHPYKALYCIEHTGFA